MTTDNSSNTLGTATQLCDYTATVLTQMVSVFQPYLGANQSAYAAHVGAHIQHIIEH